MKLIDPKLDLELSAFICGWDALEKRLGGDDIIDMCLSPRVETRQYVDRQEVLMDIEHFLKIPEIKTHEFIFKKLIAHKYYLLMAIEESLSYDEYFENTMGIKSVLFNENKIEKIKEHLDETLSLVGLSYKPGFREQLYELEKNLMPHDMGRFFDETHKSFYNNLNNLLHLDVEFNIHYSPLPEAHQFLAWISGDGKDFSVRWHPTRIKQTRPSKIKILATHELTAHAVQWALLRRKAEQNHVPKYVSFVTVHEPLQFAAEGLASTLSSVYPNEVNSDDFIKIEEAIARLNHVSLNNAYVRLSRGESLEECADYLTYNSAFTKDDISIRLNFIVANKLIGLSYRQIYGPAHETFIEIAGSHPDKNAFYRSVYDNYLLPQEITSQNKRSVTDFV